MRTIGSYEAKTHFARLLSEVSEGEKILVTKNGKAVAMLVPIEKTSKSNVEKALSRLRNLRKKLAKQKLSLPEIQQMKEQGRK